MKKIFYAMAAFAAVLITVPSVTQAAPVMKVCTGGVGGNYEATAIMLKSQLLGEVDVQIVNTKGSIDNLAKIRSGECDAAMVQSDALYVDQKDNGPAPVISLGGMYTEYVHLLCRRAANIEDIGDLTDKTKVMVGPIGSGSQVSFRGMVMADKEFGSDAYSKIPLINKGGDKTSLVMLRGGQADCMVYTGTPGAKFMTNEAQKFGDDLVLIPIEDKDFNDVVNTDTNGKTTSVWQPAVLNYDAYKTIMPSGTFGRKDVDTFGVTATFVVSEAWQAANDDAFGNVGFYLPDVAKQLKADKNLELIQ